MTTSVGSLKLAKIAKKMGDATNKPKLMSKRCNSRSFLDKRESLDFLEDNIVLIGNVPFGQSL